MRLARLSRFVRIWAFLRKLPVAQHAAPCNEELVSLPLARDDLDNREDQDIPCADVAMENITPFNDFAVRYDSYVH